MIKGVAIKLNDGSVLQMSKPCRHHHCFAFARENGLDISKKSKDQGFYTEHCEFMSRKESMKYVKHIGQPIIRDNNSKILFSEDLW